MRSGRLQLNTPLYAEIKPSSSTSFLDPCARKSALAQGRGIRQLSGLMTKQSRLGCLSVALFLALCLSLFLNFIFVLAKGARGASFATRSTPKFEEEEVQPAQDGAEGKIAEIYLRGIISSSEPGSVGETMVDDLKLQLQEATDDKKVKAIVLYVDSPGGEVTASDTIYNAVKRAGEKKKIVVYMGSLAASGGYYVSCGGNYLIANDTTFTGSIGVIMQTLHYQALFDKVGLEMITFKSGKFKDMLSGTRTLTDEEKAYVQGLVMQTYDKFVGIVAKERSIDEKTLRDGIADGRVVSGKDALTNKLIDGLGSVEDAYAKAMELGGATGAAVIRYEAPFKLGKLFRLLGESDRRAKVEVNVVEALKPKLEAGRLYYLPSFYAP
jgi:protease IV